MKKILLLSVVAVFLFTNCKNDTEGTVNSVSDNNSEVVATPSTSSPDQVEEVKPVDSENAAIVRNPATAKSVADTTNVAKMVFTEKEYNFGEAKQGDVIEHNFTFENTGKVPLIISNARSTCGCTVPSWPKQPIPPGGKGEINARFNTAGKLGNQNKVITITANTYPNETKVAIVGMVDAPAGASSGKADH